MDWIICFVIVAIVWLICWAIATTIENSKKYALPQKDHFFKRIRHLNGHPYIPQNALVDFDIINDKIQLSIPKIEGDPLQQNEYKEEINPKNILRCEAKTEQEITYDVTIPRMLLLGPLALADKKKNVRETHHYLYLSYTIKGIEINCLFESSSENVYAIQSEVTKLRIKLAEQQEGN